jgi:NADH-quinone oxidoreductase subunit I
MTPGRGLVKGLRRTLKTFFTKPVTVQYPYERPQIDERYRGSFGFSEDKCIACELCARACPNRAIEMRVAKDENNKRKLAGYRMDSGRCLYCGLCAEACPTGALAMTPEFERACCDKEGTGLMFKPEVVVEPTKVEAKVQPQVQASQEAVTPEKKGGDQ